MLKVENISKNYGRHNILDNISLELRSGECIGVLGSNGCGKSTLLGIIAGTIPYNKGRITFFDNIPHNARTCRRYTGYVPQENPLFDKLTALDNLRFWYGKNKDVLNKDLTDGLPAIFGITDYLNKRVENMSGGMKKRLSIACSLANHPPVMILDEPCAALDLPCKEDIHNYIKSYISSGNSVIITSHEESDIALCNRLYFIKDSHIYEPDIIDITKLTAYMR